LGWPVGRPTQWPAICVGIVFVGIESVLSACICWNWLIQLKIHIQVHIEVFPDGIEFHNDVKLIPIEYGWFIWDAAENKIILSPIPPKKPTDGDDLLVLFVVDILPKIPGVAFKRSNMIYITVI